MLNRWRTSQCWNSRSHWLSVGEFQVDFGLRLDPLSLLMLLIVTGVGSADPYLFLGLHARRPGFRRYFACLSLFTFSMLGIVLANNFLQMFIFWELVGVSSYLLIGFWYRTPSAADAAKKAFLTNRLGDFGFLLGILMVWAALGSLEFRRCSQAQAAGEPERARHTSPPLAGLLIFCGAMGKSRAVPASRLVAGRDGRPDAGQRADPRGHDGGRRRLHALPRVLPVCNAGPGACNVIAWIGGFTALLAALIAVQQNDIKRILAYSTLSQLGYMVMAVGLQWADAAMFHLTTHAFFKALLFLGCRLGHLRAAPRAEHLEDGRDSEEDAGDLLDLHRRHARAVRRVAFQRILQQRQHPGPRARAAYICAIHFGRRWSRC